MLFLLTMGLAWAQEVCPEGQLATQDPKVPCCPAGQALTDGKCTDYVFSRDFVGIKAEPGLGDQGPPGGLLDTGEKGLGAGVGGLIGSSSGPSYGGLGQKGKITGVRLGEPILQGPLDREDALHTLRRNLTQVRYCYQREQIKQPDLEGRVMVTLVIGPDGTAKDVQIQDVDLNSVEVVDCLKGRYAKHHFVSADDVTLLVVPIDFSPLNQMLPPPGPTVLGSLTDAEVVETLQGRTGQLDQCIQDTLARDPSQSGRVVLQWTVTRRGKMSDLEVVGGELKDPQLHTCALTALEGLRFPKASTKESTVVVYPLHTLGPPEVRRRSTSSAGVPVVRVVEVGASKRELALGQNTIILGDLDKAKINDVVESNMDALAACAVKGLTQDPELDGTVTIRFKVSPKGEVLEAVVNSSTLNDGDVEACMLETFRAMEFPPPKGEGMVIASYPFELYAP